MPGVRAVGGRRDGPQVERRAGVDRARRDRVALLAGHQTGFAGERGFVEDGGAADDEPVDRHDFAGPDRQQVTDRDGLDRHRLERVSRVPLDVPRRASEQGGQLAVRATLRVALERLAGRQHHGDDRGGEAFAEEQRPDDGQDRDEVDAELAGARSRTIDQASRIATMSDGIAQASPASPERPAMAKPPPATSPTIVRGRSRPSIRLRSLSIASPRQGRGAAGLAAVGDLSIQRSYRAQAEADPAGPPFLAGPMGLFGRRMLHERPVRIAVKAPPQGPGDPALCDCRPSSEMAADFIVDARSERSGLDDRQRERTSR